MLLENYWWKHLTGIVSGHAPQFSKWFTTEVSDFAFRRNFFSLYLTWQCLVEYDAKMENIAKGDIPMSGESHGAIAEITLARGQLVQPICTPSITKSRRDPSNLSGMARPATNCCQTHESCPSNDANASMVTVNFSLGRCVTRAEIWQESLQLFGWKWLLKTRNSG